LDALDKLTKLRTIDQRFKDIADLMNFNSYQAPFMDLFMGYTLPFLGKKVTFVSFNILLSLIMSDEHNYPGPDLHTFHPTIGPANVIAGVLSRDTSGRHYMPIIVAWKEKKVFYIEPYGDPAGSLRFISPFHEEGILTYLAWISLVKGQKREAAQGFEFVSVGLPTQFRQSSISVECMILSCAIISLFCRFFASQMISGDDVRLPPPQDESITDKYDFLKVCSNMPLLVTDDTVIAFKSGILRLLIDTIEAKEFCEDNLKPANALKTFLFDKTLDQQLDQMRDAAKSKYSADDMFNLVSDPLTPIEVFKALKELQIRGFNAMKDQLQKMSTGRLMLLLLLYKTFPTSEPDVPTPQNAVSMIFNAIDDRHPTKTYPDKYGDCPPVPFTVKPMGNVEGKHFKAPAP